MHELAESIKQYGVLQPLLLQKKGKNYEIIAGERRWRAARLAELKEVPAIIKDYSTQEVIEIALIENIQREDLNPIEEAMAYQRLIKEFNLKQDELAERVAKSRTAITNSMRLLKLCPAVQSMLIEEMLSSGHARAIIPIEAIAELAKQNKKMAVAIIYIDTRHNSTEFLKKKMSKLLASIIEKNNKQCEGSL